MVRNDEEIWTHLYYSVELSPPTWCRIAHVIQILSQPFYILVWAHQVLVSGRPNTQDSGRHVYTRVDQLSTLSRLSPLFSTSQLLLVCLEYSFRTLFRPIRQQEKCAFDGKFLCWFNWSMANKKAHFSPTAAAAGWPSAEFSFLFCGNRNLQIRQVTWLPSDFRLISTFLMPFCFWCWRYRYASGMRHTHKSCVSFTSSSLVGASVRPTFKGISLTKNKFLM